MSKYFIAGALMGLGFYFIVFLAANWGGVLSVLAALGFAFIAFALIEWADPTPNSDDPDLEFLRKKQPTRVFYDERDQDHD